MGDSLSIIFATIVAAIIMFLFPMMDTWERQDDLSYVMAFTAVVDTVDAVRNTGRLTDAMYDNLISTINSTGNRFEVKMEHRDAHVIPNGSNVELVYLNHYTNEIEQALRTAGEYTEFKKGDYFFISVKNTNKTQATVLKQSLYGTRLETFKIGVPYGGMVRNSYGS